MIRYSLLLAIFIWTNSEIQATISFETNLGKALELAKREGKLVYVHVTASWCHACKKMEKEVYTDSHVSKFLSEKMIPVKIDEAYNKGFVAKYNIHSLPTLIYFSPYGDELERYTGYRPAALFLVELKKISENYDYSFARAGMKGKSVTEISAILDSMSAGQNPKSYVGFLNYSVKENILPNKKLEIKSIYIHLAHLDPQLLDELLAKNKTLDFNDSSLLESIAINYLYRQENPGDPVSINAVIKELQSFNIKRIVELKAYIYAFQSFYLNIFGQNTDQMKLIASKSLVLNYSETADIPMLYEAVTQLVAQIQNPATLLKALSKLDDLIQENNQYYFHDLKSLILYKLNKKEESAASIKEANQIAINKGIRYAPYLHRIRTQIKVLEE